MKLLLKQAKVLDRNSAFHNQVVDLLVEHGRITQIGDAITAGDVNVISSENLHVSIGWVDIGVVVTDPGLEHKESLETLRKVAASGGFTEIATLPNTEPIVENKAGIHYLRQGNAASTVNIHPMAAVTVGCHGKDFTEMMDLQKAGAVAFTDGLKPLWNADILLKTLLYLEPINGLLINRPEEPTLAFMGQMNEGLLSTQLGMKGIPETAEELMIMRDLELLTYTEITSNVPVLHFSKVSTVAGLKRIREAKAKGLPISCDVSINNLIFSEEAVHTFDSHYKVSPPLRSAKTMKALKKGLADGTIDFISSDHRPHDEEAKKVTFDDADFGILGLQTMFPNTLRASGLALEELIAKFTQRPREILRIPVPHIAAGNYAQLTVFDPTLRWVFNDKTNTSTARNSPLLGQQLTGKVIATINNSIYETW